MNKKIVILLLLLIAVQTSTFAVIRLPELFSDNMVLQQKSKAAIWGYAEKNEKVSLTTSWDKEQYTVVANSKGYFKLHVQTPVAGGPYTIVLKGSSTITLTNVLIGEVWLCSGQSNMGMTINGNINEPVLNANDMVMNATNPNIRLFKVNTLRADTGLSTFPNSNWQISSPSSVRKFSAVAYLYAKILNAQLKVPVGVIMSTVGGTRIEAWMSEESLINFPQKKIIVHPKNKVITANDPTVLFNAMINPLIGYGIKGVLWYQGEGNRPDYQFYDKLMASMVHDWRKKWDQGEWPFYYVQIAPWNYKVIDNETVPRLREAQSRAMQLIPNSGMVVSIDVGSEFTIHPPDKETISKRLAYWALSKTYKIEGISYQSPTYRSMKVNGENISVLFDHAATGLTSYGHKISAFEIAGSNLKFFPATATITATGLNLRNENVKNPVHIRYAFKDWIVGDLFNTDGLPVTPFRTDTLAVNSLSATAIADWEILFDGKSTSEWRNYQKDTLSSLWKIEDGTLNLTKKGGGNIVTKKQYENFELVLDWKIAEAGNSGVFFHVAEDPKYKSPYETGPEVQILDDERHPDANKGTEGTHKAGANYDLMPPMAPAVKSAGEWNSFKLLVKDGHVEHWLNGIKQQDYQLWDKDWLDLVAKSKFNAMPCYGKIRKGSISLQDHGNRVWFRDIKIRAIY
jgi:sialate O-acetylesterase